jgi:hypothetical protein
MKRFSPAGVARFALSITFVAAIVPTVAFGQTASKPSPPAAVNQDIQKEAANPIGNLIKHTFPVQSELRGGPVPPHAANPQHPACRTCRARLSNAYSSRDSIIHRSASID